MLLQRLLLVATLLALAACSGAEVPATSNEARSSGTRGAKAQIAGTQDVIIIIRDPAGNSAPTPDVAYSSPSGSSKPKQLIVDSIHEVERLANSGKRFQQQQQQQQQQPYEQEKEEMVEEYQPDSETSPYTPHSVDADEHKQQEQQKEPTDAGQYETSDSEKKYKEQEGYDSDSTEHKQGRESDARGAEGWEGSTPRPKGEYTHGQDSNTHSAYSRDSLEASEPESEGNNRHADDSSSSSSSSSEYDGQGSHAEYRLEDSKEAEERHSSSYSSQESDSGSIDYDRHAGSNRDNDRPAPQADYGDPHDSASDDSSSSSSSSSKQHKYKSLDDVDRQMSLHDGRKPHYDSDADREMDSLTHSSSASGHTNPSYKSHTDPHRPPYTEPQYGQHQQSSYSGLGEDSEPYQTTHLDKPPHHKEEQYKEEPMPDQYTESDHLEDGPKSRSDKDAPAYGGQNERRADDYGGDAHGDKEDPGYGSEGGHSLDGYPGMYPNMEEGGGYYQQPELHTTCLQAIRVATSTGGTVRYELRCCEDRDDPKICLRDDSPYGEYRAQHTPMLSDVLQASNMLKAATCTFTPSDMPCPYNAAAACQAYNGSCTLSKAASDCGCPSGMGMTLDIVAYAHSAAALSCSALWSTAAQQPPSTVDLAPYLGVATIMQGNGECLEQDIYASMTFVTGFGVPSTGAVGRRLLSAGVADSAVGAAAVPGYYGRRTGGIRTLPTAFQAAPSAPLPLPQLPFFLGGRMIIEWSR